MGNSRRLVHLKWWHWLLGIASWKLFFCEDEVCIDDSPAPETPKHLGG